MEAFLLPVQN